MLAFKPDEIAKNLVVELVKLFYQSEQKSDDLKAVKDYAKSDKEIKDVIEFLQQFKKDLNNYNFSSNQNSTVNHIFSLIKPHFFINKNDLFGWIYLDNQQELEESFAINDDKKIVIKLLDVLISKLKIEYEDYQGIRPKIEEKLISLIDKVQVEENQKKFNSSLQIGILKLSVSRHEIYISDDDKKHENIVKLLHNLEKFAKDSRMTDEIRKESRSCINLMMSNHKFLGKKCKEIFESQNKIFFSFIIDELRKFKSTTDQNIISQLIQSIESKNNDVEKIFNFFNYLNNFIAENQSKEVLVQFLSGLFNKIITNIINPTADEPQFYFDKKDEDTKIKITNFVMMSLKNEMMTKLNKYYNQRNSSVFYKIKDLAKPSNPIDGNGKVERLNVTETMRNFLKEMTSTFNFNDFFIQIDKLIRKFYEKKQKSSELLSLLEENQYIVFKTLFQLEQCFGAYSDELNYARITINRCFDLKLVNSLEKFKNNHLKDSVTFISTLDETIPSYRKTRLEEIIDTIKIKPKNQTENAFYTKIIIEFHKRHQETEDNKRDGTQDIFKKLQRDIINRFILDSESLYKLDFDKIQLKEIIECTIDSEQKSALLKIPSVLKLIHKSYGESNEVGSKEKLEMDAGQNALLSQFHSDLVKLQQELEILEARFQARLEWTEQDANRYLYLVNKIEIFKSETHLNIYNKCSTMVRSLILAGYNAKADIFVVKLNPKSVYAQLVQKLSQAIIHEPVMAAIINGGTNLAVAKIEGDQLKNYQSYTNFSKGVNDIDFVADIVALFAANQYLYCEKFNQLDSIGANQLAQVMEERIKEAFYQLSNMKVSWELGPNQETVIAMVDYLHFSQTKHGIAFFEKKIPNRISNESKQQKAKQETMTAEGFLNRSGIYIVTAEGKVKFYASINAELHIYGFRKGTQSEVDELASPPVDVNNHFFKTKYPETTVQLEIKTIMETIEHKELEQYKLYKEYRAKSNEGNLPNPK